MSTTKKGREAEQKVADLLASKGHKIISMNWKTRWCEIDIVSILNKTVFFTEVKYRSSSEWGRGLEYITPIKQRQMRFAAEFWLQQNNWNDEATLQAAEVDAGGEVNLVDV